MYVSLLLMVLALICVSSLACVKDSDCDDSSNWTFVCCRNVCYLKSSQGFRCSCHSSYQCKSGESCIYGGCRLSRYTPTIRRDVTTRARPTLFAGYCEANSDCRENEYCVFGRTGSSTKSGYCSKRRDVEEEERRQRKKELENTLLNIGLPIGVPFLLMPCIIYYTLKCRNREERNRYGRPYRPPVSAPRNSRGGATGQPTSSHATEQQSLSTASSHNNRTVIEMERLSPSAPQIPATQHIPTTGEAMDRTETDEQAAMTVSNATVVEISSDLLPGAPPSYNEIRRLQNGDEEQPPPSYEEAIENYDVVRS